MVLVARPYTCRLQRPHNSAAASVCQPYLNSPYSSVMHLVSMPPPSSVSSAVAPVEMRTISRCRCNQAHSSKLNTGCHSVHWHMPLGVDFLI
jgi:hypothetical protein